MYSRAGWKSQTPPFNDVNHFEFLKLFATAQASYHKFRFNAIDCRRAAASRANFEPAPPRDVSQIVQN